jgi:hypothetical protein
MTNIIIVIFIIVIILCLFSQFILPYIIRDILRRIAIETFTALNNNNVDYWADFGTLLGIIRDNDIILGDNDVDVSVVDTPLLHEKMKQVTEDLLKKGYKTVRQSWPAYRVYKWWFFCDVYLNTFDEKNEQYVGYEENISIPAKYIGNTQKIIWEKYNLQFNAPEDINGTLSWRYGTDYMTPRRGFKGRCS